MNILFFQYGDFGEAYRRLRQGGPEYFRDQKYSVDFVSSLRSQHRVSTIAICDRQHKEELAENLQSIGIPLTHANKSAFVKRLLNQLAPDVMVLRTPHNDVLQWARKRRVPTLPLLADFIAPPRGPRSLFRTIRMRQVLRDDIFPAVANHSLNASLSVASNLRLPANRITPWDRMATNIFLSPKTAPEDPGRAMAFFAGTLSDDKGVGDCLDAVLLLKTRNIRLEFRFAGAGDTAAWESRAQTLGVADQVAFLGVIPNQAVSQEMRDSDMVIVPSRHSYAEGLPNTLCEGLASRSPVICSDHPAFASRLRHGLDVVIFKAASVLALADAIQNLISEPALYSCLSLNADKARKSLFFGTEWIDLIKLFLNDPRNQAGWVAEHSLEKLMQDQAAAAEMP